MSNVSIDTLAEWVQAYQQAQHNAAQWKETADTLKSRITEHLGEHDASVGTISGQPAVRYTPVTTQRVDTKALKEDHPELVARYTLPQTSRRFTVVDR